MPFLLLILFYETNTSSLLVFLVREDNKNINKILIMIIV
jgi:hypothetical protein